MQRSRLLAVLVVSVSLVLGAAYVPAAAGAPSAGLAPSVLAVRAAAAAPDNYTPPRGVKFNNPLVNDKRRVILRHLVRTIDSVPRGQNIRVASWNIRSDAFTDALIRAHRRGVSVRVLISYGNANPELPNKGFNRLQAELRKGNDKRKPSMRSWGRKCRSSCRGQRGIMHSKLFLFSQAGKGRNITMYSSANATDLAAGYQWNDIFTLRRHAVYQDFLRVFSEMAKDEPAKPAYLRFDYGDFRSEFLPIGGRKAKGDPVLNELAKVRCKGATGGAGNANGRTVIRIGQTATLADRGQKIAARIKELWDNGCDVKVAYAVMGNKVLAVFRQTTGRGPVPIQQIAQDWNDDGVYDRYLHMKAMTISGVYGKNTAARITYNGSQNWSGLGLISDEAGARLTNPKTEKKYRDWITYLFNNPPPGAPPRGRMVASTTSTKTDVKYGGIEF